MTPHTLRNRAIRFTRDFFTRQNIHEVMTAKAVTSPALEPYIDAIHLQSAQINEKLYLATSPEFALKKIFRRELAANPGSRGIYEIAPVFRDDRPGKNHAIEFSMVEWYLAGAQLDDVLQMSGELIGELAARLGAQAPAAQPELLDLRELFSDAGCGFDFGDEDAVVQKYLTLHGKAPHHLNRIDGAIACFNLLFDEFVLPVISTRPHLVAVSGYPEYLGALAFCENGLAQRAEIFYRGLELANGYREEFRADIARQRWGRYNEIRHLRGADLHTPDEELLSALPDMEGVCGIAVGLERVLMAVFPEMDGRFFVS